MQIWETFFREKIQAQKDHGLYRQLSSQSANVDFRSNDYLGFAQMDDHGATGSRLLSGQKAFHEILETQIAQFHGFPQALLFNSGYDANLGLLSCIGDSETTILYDALCHASIRDGLRLGRTQNWSFRHNDTGHLHALLNKCPGKIIVVIESVYSMDGDEAPIEEITSLCRDFNALLIVDEAHALGVFGPRGEGLFSHTTDTESIKVVTFGKALGAHGAAILGSEHLKKYLINFCRPFIYSTALPPAQLRVISSRYTLLGDSNNARALLQHNIQHFVGRLSPAAKEAHIPSRSGIHAFLMEGNEKVISAARQLTESGFPVYPIRYPSVTSGKERLRICLHSFNSILDIEALAHQINKLYQHG